MHLLRLLSSQLKSVRQDFCYEKPRNTLGTLDFFLQSKKPETTLGLEYQLKKDAPSISTFAVTVH